MMSIKINNKIQRLYDKYEILLDRIIGTGTYATVYMGRIVDPDIKKQNSLSSDIIAVKKIKVDGIDQKTFKLINDEINIMQKIKMYNTCDNVVKCYDIIEEFDYIYLILEYCDCGDFSTVIGRPIKEEVVKYYFQQLINALNFLYEHNIIHRDIKPKNILLKNNKHTLVLCDFGFARLKGIQRIKTICGSPLYMAPELLDEKSYTEIVDIWAIGMILYEMIYGEHPYKNCKDIDDLRDFSKKDIVIPPANNKNKNISAKCVLLMRKMLNKNEISRISVNDLLHDQWFENNFNTTYTINENTDDSDDDNNNNNNDNNDGSDDDSDDGSDDDSNDSDDGKIMF